MAAVDGGVGAAAGAAKGAGSTSGAAATMTGAGGGGATTGADGSTMAGSGVAWATATGTGTAVITTGAEAGPDPFEPVDRVEFAQERRQRAALLAIDPVEGGVLRDEEQFLDAARRERPRLGHDRGAGAAAICAAQRRDDAEGARVVAAFRDLDVGEVLRGGQDARRVGVVDATSYGEGGRESKTA